MNKEDLMEYNPEYGKVVPKSLEAWIDYALSEGSQYGRRITNDGNDAFEYLGTDKKQMIYLNQNRAVVFDGKEVKECEPELYYDKAFCNYWKRGVEKLMQAKGITETSDLHYNDELRSQMFATLDSFVRLESMLVKNSAEGINVRDEFNKQPFQAAPKYEISPDENMKMLIDTFFVGDQTRLDCFAYGLKNFTYATKTLISDKTVGHMFGNMYTDKEGNVVVDSPAVANMKYKNSMEMLRNFSYSYGQNQNQNQDKGMEI